jgi:hypothetical protein
MPVILGGSKNIKLSHETGIFWPDMKMLKVHQNAPTSILKSQNFSEGHTSDPVSKGEGRGVEGDREGRGTEGRGGEGRGGVG